MFIDYNAGDPAPMHDKAADRSDLCFVCGRKVGANSFYYEVDTSWHLIDPTTKLANSQGCFPVGRECAKKFAPNLLTRIA
jgi:hypothetical protein